MCASAFAQDEWEFGIKGGVALNMMPRTTVTPYDQFKANFGFQGGIFATYYFTEDLVGQIELLYSRKGVSTVNTAFGAGALEFSRNINYLQIPFLFGFGTLFDNRVKLLIGPELNVFMGSKIIANYFDPAFDNPNYGINPVNVGLGIQSTYFLTESLGIDLKFDFGLTRTFKEETKDKGHNAAIQLGLSYRFGY